VKQQCLHDKHCTLSEGLHCTRARLRGRIAGDLGGFVLQLCVFGSLFLQAGLCCSYARHLWFVEVQRLTNWSVLQLCITSFKLEMQAGRVGCCAE
jgi:hypothetical protein